ncbi:MAG: type VI secretion system ATPase TssH, partial [Rikenellaceae bacterium]|nr:type VI secretion system ATPase TssH [Rikenellaceae bacterium]
LTRDEVRDIVKLQIGSVAKMLAQNGVKLNVSERAVDWLAEEGFDPMFGARPVKRTLQRNLVNELSRRILAGQIDSDSIIQIDADSDGLIFKNV